MRNRVRASGGLVALLVAFLVALVASGAVAPAARADGDPASDVLLSQSLYLPADAGFSARQQTQLNALIAAAKRGGLTVRVALIPTAYDLGSVQALWQKPGTYARFLGIELSLVYKHALLVVMPNGIGLNWPGHSTAAADRLLATISPGAGSASLLAGTEDAVRAVAAADAVKLTHSPPAAGKGGSGALTDVVAVVMAILLAGILALRLRARRRGRAAPPRPSPGTVSGTRRIGPRWVVPGVAAVCCVAVGTPILIVSLVRHTPAGTRNTASGNTASGTVTASAAPSAFTWPSGRRRAPQFRLVDQTGRPVSMSGYRGRPVIVTFIDPLCRNLCPLAAQVLDQVDRELPASQRLPIVAVSVDVWADTHADLRQDFKEWRLVPQWRWAVGSPKQLAKVWNRWGVGVSVANKRIAGTMVHFITHDEFAFMVDPDGYVRALFAWPYAAKDLEAELHQLSES